MRNLLIAISCLASSACAVSTEKCDPEKQGFISSAAGVLSGCFEERQQADLAKNAAEQQKTEGLLQENQESRQLAERKKERLDAIQRRQREIEAQIPLLEQRIAEEAEVKALMEQINQYKEELERLERIEESLLDP